MTEAALLKRLMIDGSRLGFRLFRNQVGQYQLADGRWITSGLCVGSSDLIGYLPVTITEAMVGRTVAVFCAVEAKGPSGRVRPLQQAFLDVVTRAGAIGVVARDADLAPALEKWGRPL
jgi:hypothetical protein